MTQYATAVAEPLGRYYPAVSADLLAMDQRMDGLRAEWESAWRNTDECVSYECELTVSHPISYCEPKRLERSAYGLEQARTAKQFRLNRHYDEQHQEVRSIDRNFSDNKVRELAQELAREYDPGKQLPALPTTDEGWLEWEVNRFIRKIAHRTKKGSLYVGRVRVLPITSDGYFEFRCYASACSFHARHYVGDNSPERSAVSSRVELRLTRILAHWYKHH